MGDIDHGQVVRAYARWAPIYDFVFGKVFGPGRDASIEAVSRITGRVLDVGIGTGLSLSLYPSALRIVGADLSEPMLRKAQERCRAERLTSVEALVVADAQNLPFPDHDFDAVIAQFVITTVPDPERTLNEFIRVLKPGGELILVNHVGAERGLLKWGEAAFAPLARRLGWRPEFPFARIANWAAGHGGVTLLERRAIAPLSLFSMIRYRREQSALS